MPAASVLRQQARRALNTPLPLGGTSNHLKIDVLRRLHGWDAFNVTEDADLGIRLARYGYRSAVLDSSTSEEATSDLVNWARQRSRWNKGYLQTALIHLRRPWRLYRDLGPAGMLAFLLIILGTPITSLLNPVAWLMTLYWWMGNPSFIAAVFPGWLRWLRGLPPFGSMTAMAPAVLCTTRISSAKGAPENSPPSHSSRPGSWAALCSARPPPWGATVGSLGLRS